MNTKYSIPKARFREIVEKFSSQKILIVGDVGVDRYTIGSAYRLSPEAPVPVVAVQSVKDKLGMAANVADNIKSFGAVPYLATMIGEDRIADELRSLLQENSIATDYIFSHKSRRTSLKERVIAQQQQVVRIDHEITSSLNSEAEKFFLEKVIGLVGKFDGVILEDYAKGMLTDNVARAIIDEAKKKGKFVSVDPTTVQRVPGVYRGVTMFKPNSIEAEKLSGIEIRDEKSLVAAGEKLLQEINASVVIVTQGKEGMTLFEAKERPLHIPTFARSVFDVSGAGDTVISMLTLATICGASLKESALLANFAAGVEVSKQGTATVSVNELEEYMEQLGGLS